MPDADALADFQVADFAHDGVARPVYRLGAGSPVVLLHELPGITPEAVHLARRLVAAGHRVHVPRLMGTPGKPFSTGYVTAGLVRMCISRELRAFAGRGGAPLTAWLRALCRAARDEAGGAGVGVIGMCMTGNFAIALWADDSVLAAVASQPSLPLAATAAGKRQLGITDGELAAVKQRAARGERLLALRFTNDPLCPPERFARLREELGEGFEAVEIDSSRGNRHGIRRLAHSVLTLDLVDAAGHPTQAAMARVLEFLAERLA
jgi:dienelactone hydrolase